MRPASAGALLLCASCVVAATGRADTSQRTVSRPTPVLERPSNGASVISTAAAGSTLELIGRDEGWCWVIVAADSYGTRRAGWVRCSAIDEPARPAVAVVPPQAHQKETAGPTVLSQADIRAAAVPGQPDASGGRESGPADDSRSTRSTAAKPGTLRDTTNPGEPPLPVGMQEPRNRSALATWIQPRTFRASVGVGYEGARTGYDAAFADEGVLQGGFTVSTSFAILDPRIVTVDFSGDLQTGRSSRSGSLVSYRNMGSLRSYRLDMAFLSGRSAPLRVFSDRTSSDMTIRPFGQTLDPSQFTRGVRTATGFAWDINVPNRPRVQLSASTGRQVDERDSLFGYNSVNREQRAELRVAQDVRYGRYDVDFTHGSFVYDVPAAGLRSDTGNDLLHAVTHLKLGARLSLDVSGRASRYRFGLGGQTSTVNGFGADLGGQYVVTPKLHVGARYSFSSNSFEAILSGALTPRDPAVLAVTGAEPLTTRTLFHDAEARVEYGTPRASATLIGHSIGYGVPSFQAVTLSDLRTMGMLLRAERHVWGVTVTGSADGAAGQARSNRACSDPYREIGAQLGASREWKQFVRLSVDGSLREVGRLPFFPVTLHATSATATVATLAPPWAHVRAAITRVESLRDILYNDSRDDHTGYAFGVAGRWFDVAVDLNQQTARSLLLGSDVLGTRPDVALLVVSRPELARSFIGAADRSRALTVQLRPWPGVQVNGRVVRQAQQYPTLFDLVQSGEQVWAVWQLRQLQLEVGWERLESTSSFSAIRGRRFYVRVRRDLTLF